MQKTINRFNRIAIIMLIVQVLSYFTSKHQEALAEMTNPGVRIGYYIGSNFLLFLSLAFFAYAWRLKKKLRQKNQADFINNIGKPESNL